MSNNFEYLEYMNVNNSGNRNGNSNMNRYNRGNNKKNVTLREFEKEAVSKKELQHFRNVFMDLLVKDYEQPLIYPPHILSILLLTSPLLYQL